VTNVTTPTVTLNDTLSEMEKCSLPALIFSLSADFLNALYLGIIK